MHQLVLIRHGESVWNLENRFTGWCDVELTPAGVLQAQQAAALLKAAGFEFDQCHTSVLKRAIHTLWHCLDALDRQWLPVTYSWRLNERHYGGLQGLNKAETTQKYGETQVMLWRRSYDTPPPPTDPNDARSEQSDPRYALLDPTLVPRAESLKDTVARVIPWWQDTLAPALRSGQRVLVVAHGNSIRALLKHLRQISEQDIVGVNIPNGIPLVIRFDAQLVATDHHFIEKPSDTHQGQGQDRLLGASKTTMA